MLQFKAKGDIILRCPLVFLKGKVSAFKEALSPCAGPHCGYLQENGKQY